MAFVVRRPNGSWEIRESISTPSGPRARTLATFRLLTEAVAGEASRRATRDVTTADIMAAARRAGAPTAANRADAAAAELLRSLERGQHLSERLRRALVNRLGDVPPQSDSAREAVEWVDAPVDERGRVVQQLLDIGDAFPWKMRDNKPRYPRLEARG
jgi:hypothetical protein